MRGKKIQNDKAINRREGKEKKKKGKVNLFD